MINTKRMMVLDNSHRITVTNLLTPNQSDGGDTLNPELLTLNQRTGTDALGDTTGFTGVRTSETLTSSTEQYHSGTRSIKCVTPNVQTQEGIVSTAISGLVNGTVYIFGAWVYAPAGASMYWFMGDGGDNNVTQEFTGTGAWQWVEYPFTPDGSPNHYISIRTKTQQGITFYVDDLRLAKNDTTGRTAEIGTETLTITGEESHQGYRSCKVVTAATANSGFKTTATTATAGTTYTKQVRVKATAGKAMKLHLRNNDGSAIASTSFTATGGWDLVTVSGAPKTGATGVICAVTNDSAEEVTFKTDTASLETGDTAHDWIIGQGSYSFFRSRE